MESKTVSLLRSFLLASKEKLSSADFEVLEHALNSGDCVMFLRLLLGILGRYQQLDKQLEREKARLLCLTDMLTTLHLKSMETEAGFCFVPSHLKFSNSVDKLASAFRNYQVEDRYISYSISEIDRSWDCKDFANTLEYYQEQLKDKPKDA